MLTQSRHRISLIMPTDVADVKCPACRANRITSSQAMTGSTLFCLGVIICSEMTNSSRACRVSSATLAPLCILYSIVSDCHYHQET